MTFVRPMGDGYVGASRPYRCGSGIDAHAYFRRRHCATYYLRYKDANGKTCHQKIGRTLEISLEEARKRAKKLKAELTLGADLQAERKAKRAMPTFETFFHEHYLPHAKVHKRTWEKDLERYELRLKDTFGRYRLDQIRRQDIQSFHAGLRSEGLSPAYADHFIKLLRHALNLAVEWDLLEKNPASRVHLFNADNKVEHYLDEDEPERLLRVLREEGPKHRNVRLICLFLLSTGARLNEALRARWQDIDRANRVWRQLRARAGLPHLRIHDLRHQYASFLVNSGRTLYEVQQILGHSDPSVTQRYAHLSKRSLQEAADSANDVLRNAVQKSA